MDLKPNLTHGPVPSLGELLRKLPPQQWLEDLKDEYARTGSYDPLQLYRLLGNPWERVEMRPDMTAEALLAALQGRQ